MQSFVGILLLALIFVTAGFAGGVIVALMWAERERKSNTSSTDAKILDDHTEVATLFRDSEGKVVVEVEGELFTSPVKLRKSQREQLQAFTREWFPAPPAAAMPPQHPEVPKMEVVPAVSSPLPVIPAPIAKVDAKKKQAELPAPPPMSMIAQIDVVLQELAEKTDMKDRGIRLAEDPVIGVVVWVGLDRYNGVDSVPDEAVRNFIGSAVQEWERRLELKL